MTIRSGFTTRRTRRPSGVGQQLAHAVEAVVEAPGGAEHLVVGCWRGAGGRDTGSPHAGEPFS